MPFSDLGNVEVNSLGEVTDDWVLDVSSSRCLWEIHVKMTDTMQLGEISGIFFVYFKKIKIYVLLKWSVLCLSSLLHRTNSFFSLFLSLFFNCRKIALQCSYYPATWISRNYVYITSLGLPPPHSTATPILPLQVVTEHLAGLQGLVLNDLIP